MTRAASPGLEDGQTCAYCGDLAPWDSIVCPECGWRLGAVQLALVDNPGEDGENGRDILQVPLRTFA